MKKDKKMAKDQKKKKTVGEYDSWGDVLINSRPATLVIFAIGILLGAIFCFFAVQNQSISREEAEAYTVVFASYEVLEDYQVIHAKDGTSYDVFPHKEKDILCDKMDALPQGTELFLLVHPINGYVIEIRTDTEELLNLEASQAEIGSDNGFFLALGVIVIAASVFLVFYAFLAFSQRKREQQRTEERLRKQKAGKGGGAIRRADMNAKHRVLLEATVGKYKICYRRRKSTNELVVDGLVYDEKRAMIEFAHQLCAVIDGHTVLAGLNEASYSYIEFDGMCVAKKKRNI